ncbi:nucleoside-diphosphate sugar epimerase [Paenibacillus contaminans]|uniref:Nucleoside-diphosphate sugar epimerase n=1 Tax=Paenibacillus contaminans TaxID=450362 RepID=A0A329MW16_9BACL|nr:nucleoside-diphosphate sugar epimerase [Paenibacillus contaminans]RAV22067.1 nucleoside-diphosphate sugar epimerase [Paenibacillus contaminans]
MDQQITTVISHMAKSHLELARIIEAKRQSVVHAAKLVTAIPNENPSVEGFEGTTDFALQVTKNVTSYLNSLADLEEALAENLTQVMKELNSNEGE